MLQFQIGVQCWRKGKTMKDKVVKVLFESLSKIMYNEVIIMRHLGITKHDSSYDWDDSDITKLIDECDDISYEYTHFD